MGEERKRELEKKRFDDGLTHEEANELGRMMAEAEGKPYASHDDRPEGDEESQLDEAASPGPSDDHRPEEERAVGTKRQPVPPAGSGYAPPKGSDELPT
jgi:hypothetical protein